MKLSKISLNRLYALLGFLGGLLFVAGDCLIYCFKGNTGADIEPLWSNVSEWRFILSAVLGFVGMILMLPAMLSFYRMIDRTCGKILRLFTVFMGIGVVSTGFLHFSLGTLLPVTYKAVLFSGGSVEAAVKTCEHWSSVLTPINLCLIFFLFFEYIVHFCATVSGRLKLPRITCLLGITGALIIGIIWKLIFAGTTAEFAFGAFESLGEAFTFLTAYLYWRKTAETDD